MNDIFRSQFRLPADLADQLRDAADGAGRSLNAEIVVRLQQSFGADQAVEKAAFEHGFEVATLRQEVERLKAERMQFFQERASADRIGQLLDKLPAELTSQYGLHLYRSELDRTQASLRECLAAEQQASADLQAGITAGAPQATLSDLKKRQSDLSRQSFEIREQIVVLEQAISGIHTYREVSGLPEIRKVQRLFSGS